MEKRSLVAAIVAGICIVVFSQPTLFAREREVREFLASEDRNTIILQDFDEEESGTKRLSWRVNASRYVTRTDQKPYPLIGFLSAYPSTMGESFLKEERASMRVLGVRAAFNQKGYNFVELIPYENADTPREVDKNGNQLPGIYLDDPILQIGAYVWGSSRDYTIEAHFINSSGENFTVPMGSVKYDGWDVLVGEIPIRHYKKGDLFASEKTYALKLTKLVLWTKPSERVDDFVTYLDNLFVTTTVKQIHFESERLGHREVIDTVDWKTAEETLGNSVPEAGQQQ